MKSILSVKQFSKQQVDDILILAQDIIDNKNTDKLDNKIVANLFFEPSTRTQYSFITAQEKLNCKVINFNASGSSLIKGETFYDTLKTFEAFNVDALVVRSSISQWYKPFENDFRVKLINAGDGNTDHPSQTLLDLLTIKQHFNKLEGLKVLIVGDIIHSRVAHSNIDAFKKMGMEVFLSAPKEFQDNKYSYVDFDETINKVDVINMLRIQNERLEEKININIEDYNKQYGLNLQRLNKSKPSAIVIHPAPFNRNVEINDDVIEHKKSKIFKQMENGVYIRMAMLLKLLGDK